MTIATTARKAILAGNGINTNFAFNFAVRSAADLQIYYTDANGVQTLLAANLYSVALSPVPNGQLWAQGGSVTYPLAGAAIPANTELTIARNVPLTQTSTLINQGGYSPQTVEQMADLLAMAMQQINETIGRALTIPISSSASTLMPAPTANALIGWDPTGTMIINIAAAGSIPLPLTVPNGGTGSGTAGGALTNLGFSAYVKTLVAAATAAALRALFTPLTTLGDLWVFGAADSRQAVGTDGQVLGADSTQATGLRYLDPPSRGALAGCQLTWVSGTSFTVGAGKARDDADTETMKLTAATTMSSLAIGWVVGNNQPKCRTGLVLANGMTLHVYVIKRLDTGVVDWILTDEASNPTLPANYTKSRRIAAIRFTTGAQTILQFSQQGDEFLWSAAAADVTATGPGNTAVTRTLTVPTGIKMWAVVGAMGQGGATFDGRGYLSSLDQADETAAARCNFGTSNPSIVANSAAHIIVRTNTSAQIRSRMASADAGAVLQIATYGWIDRRGRDD